jgi:hypothetical protein
MVAAGEMLVHEQVGQSLSHHMRRQKASETYPLSHSPPSTHPHPPNRPRSSATPMASPPPPSAPWWRPGGWLCWTWTARSRRRG